MANPSHKDTSVPYTSESLNSFQPFNFTAIQIIRLFVAVGTVDLLSLLV